MAPGRSASTAPPAYAVRMNWWVANLLESSGYVALWSWIFWVLLSICLHELAHGWAAIWQGDDTPIRLGRMTLNPITHMGPMSLLVFAIIGIAWGVMPVNPMRFRSGRLGEAMVAAAGPAMNLLLAGIALTALAIFRSFGPSGNFSDNLMQFFWTGGLLNLVLVMLNLIPFPPLDGARILAGLSNRAADLYSRPEAGQFAMFGLLFVLFFISGFLFDWAAEAGSAYVSVLRSILS